MRNQVLATAVLVGVLAAANAALGDDVVSRVHKILVAKTVTLPEGPHPGSGDSCIANFAQPKTAAGKAVQARGWGVMSEEQVGGYQLVSFGGEFVPGLSGACMVHQGNVGIFAGSTLKAILYTGDKGDELIGVLVPREGGSVRLWSGEDLGSPVADIAASSNGIVVGKVAAQDSFCHGSVKVPNVYNAPITTARQTIRTAGWQPIAQPVEAATQQEDLHKLGIAEAVSCSGTGYGFCSYSYGQNGATLNLTSAGELGGDNTPFVTDYAVTCAP